MRSTFALASIAVVLVGCSAGGSPTRAAAASAARAAAPAGGSSERRRTRQRRQAKPAASTRRAAGRPAAECPSSPPRIFAEGPNTLYKLDPDTLAFTKVADFQGCNGVIDIAIDKDGVMYGTTSGALWLIDSTTAACTHIAGGAYPNSLSLVPKGTVDPNEEALVGYNGSDYVRIDTTTGKVSPIGSLGDNGYASSGDIVSVIGGGTYLTVNGGGCNDCIIQVDPTTGAMMNMIGPLGHQSVFGLAFWAGTAYGFDDSGQLFSIDLSNGSTTSIPKGGFDVPQFWGAGSTTSAPVTPK